MSSEPSGDQHAKDRRRAVWLSEEQIDEIAERAKELAMQQVYAEVGKSVVRTAMYIIGAGLTALAAYLGWKAP